MSDDVVLPLEFTDAAAKKVKVLIADEENPNLKLRVYITGGGCSGFQYGFTFDDQINEGDMTIEKQGVGLVVDPMSLQYLVGGSVDYTEMKKPTERWVFFVFLVARTRCVSADSGASPAALRLAGLHRFNARYRPEQRSAASDASEWPPGEWPASPPSPSCWRFPAAPGTCNRRWRAQSRR